MFKKYTEAPRKTPYLRSGEKVEGVQFQTLATGEQMMITSMFYEKNAHVPEHSHPEEQAGFVVSGKVEVKIDGIVELLEKGDSYVILGNLRHSLTAHEVSLIADVFSPPRDDYKD